jgi:hypothetical protein
VIERRPGSGALEGDRSSEYTPVTVVV